MDYRDYIDPSVFFHKSFDFINLENYLRNYPIISEINAEFLKCANPDNSPEVKKIVKTLNHDLNDTYISYAPNSDNAGTLKCIYDQNRIKTETKLIKIADLLYAYKFNNN